MCLRGQFVIMRNLDFFVPIAHLPINEPFPKELAKLKLIFRGKRYGFSLEEIKEMVLLFDFDRSGIQQLERTVEYGEQKFKRLRVK